MCIRDSYNVLLPDGRTQIVEYEADQGGYKPKITYQGSQAGGYSGGGSGGYSQHGGSGTGSGNGGYQYRK